MYHGILCLRKPQTFTSHDVVAKLRGILRQRRIGHAGTLDPMAQGVLVVLLGGATRASDDAAAQDKEYLAGLRLGTVTDTQDIWGQVLETRPAAVDAGQLEAALAAFRGEITQLPPMVSAVQVGGQRLYKLARQGVEIERPSRDIVISCLETVEPDALGGSLIRVPEGDIALRVTCSKGTYIRTLCHDIGALLGCGGCMSALTRVRSGSFGWEEALTLEQVEALHGEGTLAGRLMPVEAVYAHLPAVALNGAGGQRVRHGNFLDESHLERGEIPAVGDRCRVYLPDGGFYMTGVGRQTPRGTAIACDKTFWQAE